VQYALQLYAASADALLERLRRVPDGLASVAVLIAHNPAIQRLALDLARPSLKRHELETKFPTAAAATLASPGASWCDIDRGDAELVSVVRPRHLRT
jgi:phosphohistidine phosphatase